MSDDDPEFSDHRARFEAGERWVLLEVVTLCTCINREPMPVPGWAVNALLYALLDVLRGEKTWNDVFGLPWEHEKKSRRAFHTESKIHDVWYRVNELRRTEGAPLTNDLFEYVGKELGLSRPATSRLYYKMLKDLGGRLDPLLLQQIKDLDEQS